MLELLCIYPISGLSVQCRRSSLWGGRRQSDEADGPKREAYFLLQAATSACCLLLEETCDLTG